MSGDLLDVRNLVKTFSGLLRPDAGEIHFRGERVDGLRRHGVSQRGITGTFQIPRELERRGKGQTGERLGPPFSPASCSSASCSSCS